MNDCQTDRTITARKNHTCAECGRSIPKGASHHLQKGVCDGSWYSWRVHSDCAELYWALNNERGSWWDDYLPVSEYCISEIEHLRGKFPHAVCRQELARELSNIRYEKRRALTGEAG